MDDPASRLLAESAQVAAGDVVIHMNCGNGRFGVATAEAGVAGRVVMSDRNVVAVDALRATPHAEVVLGHGAIGLPADIHAGGADVIAIRIPREKVALLQLLWDAFHLLRIDGRCYIAGPTNEGIKSAATLMEQLFGNAAVVNRANSGRAVVARRRTDTPADVSSFGTPYLSPDTFHTADVTLRNRTFALYSRPGVFSWDHLDEATSVLAGVMRIDPGESVLDLGCGAGALGIAAAMLSQTGRVVMADADVEAVRSATRGAQAAGLTNAETMVSDVGTALIASGSRFDVVVMNPPFHAGKATDLALPLRFIDDAWQVLNDGGRMYLVANRTLPYETAIRQRFGNFSTTHDGPRFKVVSATRTRTRESHP